MEQLIKQFMEKIDQRFDSLEIDINELKVGQAQLQGDVNELKVGQVQLQGDVVELKAGQEQLQTDVKNLQADVIELKEGQARLQRNIIDSLGVYTEKITEYIDDRTDALNKRVYRMEVEFERLNKQ